MQAVRLGLAARVDEIEVGQAAGPLIARPFVQPQGRAVVRDDVQEKRTAGRRQGVLEHPVEQLPRHPAPLVLGKHAERQDVRRRLAVEEAAGLAHQVAVLYGRNRMGLQTLYGRAGGRSGHRIAACTTQLHSRLTTNVLSLYRGLTTGSHSLR